MKFDQIWQSYMHEYPTISLMLIFFINIDFYYDPQKINSEYIIQACCIVFKGGVFKNIKL